MPIIDSENVTNTLIEYITTNVSILPCVYQSAAAADEPDQLDPVVGGQPLREGGEPVRGVRNPGPCWPGRADRR